MAKSKETSYDKAKTIIVSDAEYKVMRRKAQRVLIFARKITAPFKGAFFINACSMLHAKIQMRTVQ